MADKDVVHGLIHSMSKNEKRYFKIKHLTNKRSNFSKLFSALSLQKEYDEKALKKKFRNENFLKHLSVTKLQLQEKILLSLSEFHSDKQFNMKIIQKMNDATTLFQRGFYEQAHKYLERAKELIIEYESYDLLITYMRKICTFWQQELFANISNNDIIEMEQFVLSKLVNIEHEVKLLSSMQRLNRLSKTKGYVNKDEDIAAYDLVFKDAVLQDANQLKTTKNKFNFYFIKSLYHYVLKNEDECIQNSLDVLSVISSKAETNSYFIGAYMRALSNLVTYLLSFRKFKHYDAFKLEIEKAKGIISEANLTSADNFIDFINIAELKYLLLSDSEGNNATDNDIEQLIDLLSNIDEKTNTINTQSALFYIASAKFYLKQFDESLQFIEKLTQSNGSNTSSFHTIATILKIICHFELKNYQYMAALLRNSKRALSKRDLYHENEVHFFQLIRDLIRYQLDSDKRNETIQQYLIRLNAPENSDWSARLYFNFENWLNAKMLQKV